MDELVALVRGSVEFVEFEMRVTLVELKPQAGTMHSGVTLPMGRQVLAEQPQTGCVSGHSQVVLQELQVLRQFKPWMVHLKKKQKRFRGKIDISFALLESLKNDLR